MKYLLWAHASNLIDLYNDRATDDERYEHMESLYKNHVAKRTRKVREVFSQVESINMQIKAEYSRIKANISADDPGTAGDAAEEVFAGILRDLLPQYNIVVKGRIIGEEDEISPQVDILVLDGNYPPSLLDKKIYHLSAVRAAVECKLSLRLADIEKAVETAEKINELVYRRANCLYQPSLYYGLVGLSTGIVNANKKAHTSVHDAIIRHTKTSNPLLGINYVMVPDEFYIKATNEIRCWDVDDPNEDIKLVSELSVWDKCPPWTYPDVEPVGLFILDLISHLALSDQRLGSAMRHYKVFDVLRDYSTEWLSALLSEFVTDKMVADIREGRIADDAIVFPLVI